MVNDFVIEVPELNDYFPQEYLIQYWKENEHLPKDDDPEWAPYGMEGIKFTTSPIFDVINKRILKKEMFGWFVKKISNLSMRVHIDFERDAALILPVGEQDCTIRYLNDSNILYEHTYSVPTILNAQIPHAAFNQKIGRKFIQISLYFNNNNWNDIIKQRIVN
tara:strand:+ start:2642 stop:3130 length:489 start_codon:yes stop_codon:yes gene_type:complete